MIGSFTSIRAMEMFGEKGSFLKSKIYDIQFAYYIPEEESDLLEKSLKILGLGRSNTPLDIRYYYELMKKKDLDKRVYDRVTEAYNNLMTIFSRMMKQEMDDLKAMSFDRLEKMELAENPEYSVNQFLARTHESIDKAIDRLEKKLPTIQAAAQVPPVETESLEDQLVTIQQLLRLSPNASPQKVQRGYERYAQGYSNYTNKMLAHATMGNISTGALKERLSQFEEVSKAYDRYKEKTGQK